MAEINVMGLEDIEVENTSVEDIDSETVNLIFVAVDGSGSMDQYVRDMCDSLIEFKAALADSKECDEILLARADFAADINVGGYKPIVDFTTNYNASGMTALYDVVVDGEQKLTQYVQFLRNQGMRVKAVFSVFSDGEDTCSHNQLHQAKQAISTLNSDEVVTAFISFGGGATSVAKSLGFQNVLDVGGSASELRRAFNCLSKSVIENSQSVVQKTSDFFDV